jgi:hypothetical protein
LCDEFPPFCKHRKGHQHQQQKKLFSYKNIFKNDIIFKWVLGFVIKILRYFNKFVRHISLITNTCLNFLMDDLEKDYKIEKMKRF